MTASIESHVWMTSSEPREMIGALVRSAVRPGGRVLVLASSYALHGLRVVCDSILAAAGPAGEAMIAAGRDHRVKDWALEYARRGLWLAPIEPGQTASPFASVAVGLGSQALSRIQRAGAHAPMTPEYRVAGEALAADAVVSLSAGSPVLNIASLEAPPRVSDGDWASALDLNRIVRHAGRRGELDASRTGVGRAVVAVVERRDAWLCSDHALGAEVAARRLGWWSGKDRPLELGFALDAFRLTPFERADQVAIADWKDREAGAAA